MQSRDVVRWALASRAIAIMPARETVARPFGDLVSNGSVNAIHNAPLPYRRSSGNGWLLLRRFALPCGLCGVAMSDRRAASDLTRYGIDTLPLLLNSNPFVQDRSCHRVELLRRGVGDFVAHGFEALQALVADHTPEHVAQVCGVSTADLLTAARWFATSPATLSLYCQGLNQSRNGTAKNAALINLHLATAQLGKPGAGPLSLTGQPNAMGGREVGGMANLLSAHRDLANPQHRAEVAALWGVPDVPAQPGLTAVELFEAAADGQIKALWIACTNPAQSMPDQKTVRRALERAEFVIVQEAFATAATCDLADLLLGERMVHEAFRVEAAARAEAMRAITKLRIDSHELWLAD